ncbi:MAG: DUF1559 domain-containing protein [Armatimonadetes bacterium]|nr:DUF1559 domain-containing protein [Armatimonadota bacterium]
MKKTTSRGFTLIELLVVIAIIALLAAILFPVFASTREKARQTVCVSNLKQIGLAVRMYVQDFDETFPVFHAYNFSPAPGQPGHRGVESQLEPYTKSRDIFRCPDDSGGQAAANDVPGSESYRDAYGSSYRFMAACFSVVHGADGSYQNNAPIDPMLYAEKVVTDADYEFPAETRIMRDEMFSFFSAKNDPGYTKYGYFPPYFSSWHGGGGGMVFADGHAKFVVSERYFQETRATPAGRSFLDGCWYGCE